MYCTVPLPYKRNDFVGAMGADWDYLPSVAELNDPPLSAADRAILTESTARQSTVMGAVVSDATRVQNVYYTKIGPVEQEEPAQYRGSDTLRPCGWIRGQTPPIEYTLKPLASLPSPQRSKAHRTKQRQADARLRRGLRDAWCDPERARKDAFAAATAYAAINDQQGLATAIVAHAQTRIGQSKLSGLHPYLLTHAALLAGEEYSHAHAIYSSLINAYPECYDACRVRPFQAACNRQRFRAHPISFTAADAAAASIGE